MAGDLSFSSTDIEDCEVEEVNLMDLDNPMDYDSRLASNDK